MDKSCRVSVDLAAYELEQDKADRLGAMVDERATELYEQAIGYRKSGRGVDVMDYFDSLSDDEIRDVLCTFLSMNYSVIGEGRDTRSSDALFWLDKQIEEWAQREALKELEEE